MNCFFCSSEPHCRIVGPTRVSPKKSARSGPATCSAKNCPGLVPVIRRITSPTRNPNVIA